MNKKVKRRTGILLISVFAIMVLSELMFAPNTSFKEYSDVFYFDFGEQYTDGWRRVTAEDKYDPRIGYGFSDTSKVSNEIIGSRGVLYDAVKMDGGDVYFDLDVEPGMYEIDLYSGRIDYMTVAFEDFPAIINMMSSKTEAQIEIPVLDGRLNMSLQQGTHGDDFSVSAMIVRRTGDLSDRKKRMFVVGDSIAAEFYPLIMYQPLDETYRGGWGQLIGQYTADSIYVHNLASPGQCARSFISWNICTAMSYYMREGDYAVISLGLNDKLSYSEQEFRDYLGTVLGCVKDAGGIPIIVSEPDPLDCFDDKGAYAYRDDCYADALRETAQAWGAVYVDWRPAFTEYLRSLPYDELKRMYWTNRRGVKDNIHYSRNGAAQAARVLAEQFRENGLTELSEKVTDYGLSAYPVLKCRRQGNTLLLENTRISELPLQLVGTDASGQETVTAELTLPGFDATSEDNVVSWELPGDFEGSMALRGEGIYIEMDG